MGFQRTVEHTITDANDNSGYQARVNGHVATGFHADRFFHPRFDNLADIIIQIPGDANIDIGHAAQFSEELFGLARDGSQELEPTMPREDFEEVRYVNRSRFAENAIQQGFFLLR